MDFSTSLRQRRILIVYYIFHLTALFTTSFHINWNFTIEHKNDTQAVSDGQISYTYYRANQFYIFTKAENSDSNKEYFWPFTEFYSPCITTAWKQAVATDIFNGIFYGYDFSEFCIYSILPFLVIIIKKLWKKNNV